MFNRKHKKGMADAAKAYEAFGRKQEEALKHILEEVRQGKRDMQAALKEIDGHVDNIYDYLQSKEKANLYTVYTPFDLKELGEKERLFLIGALFRLTMDRVPNEDQQNYLRAVQKYLEIKEPPFGTDPMAIENIEDLPTQKAILQAVLEFLRLQDGDSYDETELQQEFLDAFSVNNKGRQEIVEHIELLYTATGAKGLAEKYGYVPEEESEKNMNKIGSIFPEKDVGSITADQQKYIDDFVRGMGMCDNIIETKTYLVGRDWNGIWVRMDKITGEKRAYREDPIHALYIRPVVINDTIYIPQCNSLSAFDISTMSTKIVAYTNNIADISAFADKVVFVDDSKPYFYDTITGRCLTVSGVTGCTSVFAVRTGFYFTSLEDEFNAMRNYHKIQYYDYESKGITTVSRNQEDIYLLQYCAQPNIFYVSCARYLQKPLKRVGSIEKIYDVMDYSNDTRIHAYQDCLIFVASCGKLTKLDYASGETMILSDDASQHHHLDGGLFRKSESWDTPIEFSRIGNYIFYNPDGDCSKICKISLDKPDEKEILPHMNIREFQQSLLF
nr:hypothetical protein [uncultured Flavonifractor sp.]